MFSVEGLEDTCDLDGFGRWSLHVLIILFIFVSSPTKVKSFFLVCMRLVWFE